MEISINHVQQLALRSIFAALLHGNMGIVYLCITNRRLNGRSAFSSGKTATLKFFP